MFVPFTIKCRRTELKRYGIIFTCLASITVHNEVANTMDTDFFQALRRFIVRRRNMSMLRSDTGTSFVEGQTELSKAFKEIDHERISSFLQGYGSDWIRWKRNPPAANHIVCIWER